MSLSVCMIGTTEWAEIVSLIFHFTFSSWLYSSGHIGTHLVEGLLQYSLHCTSLRIEYCSVITSDYTKIILHIDLVWQWGLNIVWHLKQNYENFLIFGTTILHESQMPVDTVAARSIKFCNKKTVTACRLFVCLFLLILWLSYFS